MDPYAVDINACRGRQRRLLDAVEPLGVDLTVVTRRESVQWLTGVHVRAPFEPIAAIDADGRVTLVVPDRQIAGAAAADDVLGYEAKWHSTTRDEQRAASSAVLQAKLPSAPKRAACEFEAFCPQLFLSWNAPLVEIDAIVFELRRRKDPDELRMLRRANEANRAMYERAREIVIPGVNELDVYSELQAIAVETLGEPLTYFGQDFQSGARGGPPRNRAAEKGELFILDLGVGFRGYYSDNARTIAVGGEPTDKQRQAWKAVTAIFDVIQSKAQPGVRCRELFDAVDRQLNKHAPWVFNHHLGHGVGLAPQEGPHLNPRWDDTLAEGNFLAVEPGVYHEELRVGLRLENNYLVTATGVELLTDWPLEL
ncbi:MAG TPA: Xaa-Pro peptidase family protein [Lacipirellulaceae bacterium]|nr:Xaa-Pro peptidase family protein [Lacipirellulaceae bacterium]